MPIKVTMPALSPTMTEANLAKWLVKEGDQIQPGDVIAEIETDKAIMEFEAVEAGIVHKLLLAEGSRGVKIGQPIAIIKEEDDSENDLQEFTVAAVANGNNGGAAASPDTHATESVSAPAAVANEAKAVGGATDTTGSRINASPLARRVAAQNGVSLTSIGKGSGPNGRLIRDDILDAIAKQQSGSGAAAAISAPNTAIMGGAANNGSATPYNMGGGSGGDNGSSNNNSEIIPLSNMRRVIADRLTSSKQDIPHFYLTVSCEVSALLSLRQEINSTAARLTPHLTAAPNLEANAGTGAAADAAGVKVSINDLVVKAVARAAAPIPEANTIWNGENLLHFTGGVDIAVAVAIPDGLITPVIRHANQKSISAISSEIRSLAAKARINRLRPEEFSGGTITVSNLGMYNVEQFSAIINPPQSSIIAVGGISKQPVVQDDAIVVGNVMQLTISCDHRVIDGAVAAQFLNAIKQGLENPLSLLL